MQSVMLMACKFQWDKNADLATSIMLGGRGKRWGFGHVSTTVPFLHGAGLRPPYRVAGNPPA